MFFDSTIPVLNKDTSEEVMDVLKDKFPQYDSTYLFNASCEERRLGIEDAFDKCEDYLDKNFTEEAKRPGNFFSRLWELQLCIVLMYHGYKLQKFPHKKKQIARPDFCVIDSSGQRIWIEAVCPQLGRLEPKPVIQPGEIYSRTSSISDNLEISAPRTISTVISKYKKLDLYKENEDFHKTDKFIVAINTEQISHFETGEMAKELVLYGMGLQFIKRNGETGRYFHHAILDRRSGIDVPVPTALFHSEDFSHLSAVISSDCWFSFGENYIDSMSSRIHTYLNHNSKPGLDINFIKFGTKHTMSCEGEYCHLNHHPVVN